MNRRNNNRNRNSQYDQHFVPAGGNNSGPTAVSTNNQQQQLQQQQQAQQQLQQQQQQQAQMVANDSITLDDSGDENNDQSGGGGSKMRKFFANRKNLSSADRKRLEKNRKARQLRRLRKLLSPKNAVVALHELQGPGMSEFTITTNGQETTAEIVVNNVRYEATAPNKHLAKARASEKALRDMVISQMSKTKESSTNGNGNANDGGDGGDVEMTDVSDDADNIPMLHLASFALYKLFNEWQNEGFEIPAIKPPKPPVKLTEGGKPALAPKVTKTKADLPADAATRHPTALLAYMRPQVPYEDLGGNNETDPAKREFSVGVTIDGQRFVGKARSKKLARKEAAQAACSTLFGVTFIETASTE